MQNEESIKIGREQPRTCHLRQLCGGRGRSSCCPDQSWTRASQHSIVGPSHAAGSVRSPEAASKSKESTHDADNHSGASSATWLPSGLTCSCYSSLSYIWDWAPSPSSCSSSDSSQRICPRHKPWHHSLPIDRSLSRQNAPTTFKCCFRLSHSQSHPSQLPVHIFAPQKPLAASWPAALAWVICVQHHR
jgi:hypothetical protein